MDRNAIYNALTSRIHVWRTSRDGKKREWSHVPCPYCGKEPPARNGTHFSFCADVGKCFVCTNRWTILELAQLWLSQSDCEALGIRDWNAIKTQTQKQRPAPPPVLIDVKPPWWRTQRHATRLLRSFSSVTNKYELWSRYKPLTPEIVDRFGLGVGVLPSSSIKLPRLIIPIFKNNALIGLHGRAFLPHDDHHDMKWTCSAGSSKTDYFSTEPLSAAAGRVIVICENYIDAILGYMDDPAHIYMAAGSAQFQQAWFDDIANSGCSAVYICYDYDPAGNSSKNPDVLAAWEADWRARNPKMPADAKLPQGIGPRVHKRLHRLGLVSILHEWPDDTPWHFSFGDMVEQQWKQQIQKAAA